MKTNKDLMKKKKKLKPVSGWLFGLVLSVCLTPSLHAYTYDYGAPILEAVGGENAGTYDFTDWYNENKGYLDESLIRVNLADAEKIILTGHWKDGNLKDLRRCITNCGQYNAGVMARPDALLEVDMSKAVLDVKDRPQGTGNGAWNVNGLHQLFYQARNLEKVILPETYPVDIYFNETFQACQKLAEIQNIDKLDMLKVKAWTSAFAGCWVLPNIELPKTDVTFPIDLSGTFYGCRAMTKIDISMFKNISSLSSTFNGATGLAKFEDIIFADKVFDEAPIAFVQTFANMNLVEIDLTRFPRISSLQETFYGSALLEKIILPADMAEDVDLKGAFKCAKLTEIVNLETWKSVNNFYQTFMGASSIQHINLPEGTLYQSAISFYETFWGCKSLLFINNLEKYTNISTFRNTFYNCGSLLNIFIGADISGFDATQAPGDAFNGINVNGLVFLPKGTTVPSEWARYLDLANGMPNFVIGNKVEDNPTAFRDIKLYTNYEFHCPFDVKINAGNVIRYVENNGKYVSFPSTNQTDWYPRVVPFDVKRVAFYNNKLAQYVDLDICGNMCDTGKDYFQAKFKEVDTSTGKISLTYNAEDMKAYTPYFLKFNPGKILYAISNGVIYESSSTGTTLPATPVPMGGISDGNFENTGYTSFWKNYDGESTDYFYFDYDAKTFKRTTQTTPEKPSLFTAHIKAEQPTALATLTIETPGCDPTLEVIGGAFEGVYNFRELGYDVIGSLNPSDPVRMALTDAQKIILSGHWKDGNLKELRRCLINYGQYDSRLLGWGSYGDYPSIEEVDLSGATLEVRDISIGGGGSFAAQNYNGLHYLFADSRQLKKVVLPVSYPNDVYWQATFLGCRVLETLENQDKMDLSKFKSLEYAFSGCLVLPNIQFPNTPVTHEVNFGSTFSSCQAMTKIDISMFKKITNMSSTFTKCIGLAKFEDIVFAEEGYPDVVDIRWAFSETKFEEVDLTPVFSRISSMYYTFGTCTSLKKVILPENMAEEVSMEGTFKQCQVMTEVVNLETFKRVTSFAYTFHNCLVIEEISLPTEQLYTGAVSFHTAFLNCQKLKNIDNQVNFTNVSSLSSTFANCYVLTHVFIGMNIESLTNQNVGDAFSGTNRNALIYFPSTVTNLPVTASNWGSARNYVIGNKVEDNPTAYGDIRIYPESPFHCPLAVNLKSGNSSIYNLNSHYITKIKTDRWFSPVVPFDVDRIYIYDYDTERDITRCGDMCDVTNDYYLLKFKGGDLQEGKVGFRYTTEQMTAYTPYLMKLRTGTIPSGAFAVEFQSAKGGKLGVTPIPITGVSVGDFTNITYGSNWRNYDKDADYYNLNLEGTKYVKGGAVENYEKFLSGRFLIGQATALTELTLDLPVCGQEASAVLELTAFLQGPVQADGTMSNYLQEPDMDFNESFLQQPVLPKTNPYQVLVAGSTDTYVSLETINNVSSIGKVVDWILVEIWKADYDVSKSEFNHQVLERQALLLRPDGSVVNTAGSLPEFETQTGDVYIVLRHRNHLSVMSQPVSSFTGDVVYNFGDAVSKALQIDARYDQAPQVLKNGVWCLIAGDLDGFKEAEIVDDVDFYQVSTDFKKSASDSYILTDFDMNGFTDDKDMSTITTQRKNNTYSSVYYFVSF